MRSSNSIGANSPLGSQQSARCSSKQTETDPENSKAGVCGEMAFSRSISLAPLDLGHDQVSDHEIDSSALHKLDSTVGV